MLTRACIDNASAKIDVASLQANEPANAYFSTPVWSVYIWVLSILESDSEIQRSGPLALKLSFSLWRER